MGLYDVRIYDNNIKARVVDHESQLDTGIKELESEIGESGLVGFDLKGGESSVTPQLLLLYVKGRCLLIQLGRMSSSFFPLALASFLKKEKKIFVGERIDSKVNALKQWRNGHQENRDSWMKNRVEIGEFVAKVFKKPGLQLQSSVDLASTLCGYHLQWIVVDPNKETSDWGAVCFTDDQVYQAMIHVFLSYFLGLKCLNML